MESCQQLKRRITPLQSAYDEIINFIFLFTYLKQIVMLTGYPAITRVSASDDVRCGGDTQQLTECSLFLSLNFAMAVLRVKIRCHSDKDMARMASIGKYTRRRAGRYYHTSSTGKYGVSLARAQCRCESTTCLSSP